MTAAVVANSGADRLGNRGNVAAKVVDRHRLQVRVALERLVEVGHIGVVMLGSVDVHRERVDRWFERVLGVRKFGERKGHGLVLLHEDGG